MNQPDEVVPVVLRLYVAGQLPNSVEAVANVKLLCEGLPAGLARVEVIDVLREPERALTDGIMVTPTLVRAVPQPPVKMIGTLSDLPRVYAALGLKPELRS